MSAMFGVGKAGVLGASVVLAGGVAYLVWTYASTSRGRKPETRQQDEDGEDAEGDIRKGEKEDEQVVATPVVAATVQKTSESGPPESAGTQVLVLGLEGAGKTSLLHCWATGCLEQDVQPTQGFNAVSINREDLKIEFLEIGGEEELRQYWQKYMSKAILLVFVVDSSSQQLFPLARRHLHELLALDPHLPLIVVANKQDLPGACRITDLHDALSLSELGDRRLFLIGTRVKRGQAELNSGIQDARELILHLVGDAR